MNEGLMGLERHEWVIDDRILIFVWTISLNVGMTTWAQMYIFQFCSVLNW